MRDIKRDVVCMTETHLDKSEEITLKGYKIYYNNNKQGQGGILIAVKDNLENITIVTEKILDKYQTLWIKINNNRNIINIGTIYAPQESRNNIRVFNEMYKSINNSIIKCNVDKEKLYIVGDFNAKIGKLIKGNREEITKSGTLLLQETIENNLTILNTMPKCIGKWTRILGTEKSIIDYAIVNKEDELSVESIRIDEDKMDTPRYKKGNKYVYTDHCAIITEMNWTKANKLKPKEETVVINKETLAKFYEETNKTKLTKIANKKTNLNDKYREWQDEVKKIMANCFPNKTKQRNKTTQQNERTINRIKKMVRKRKCDPIKRKEHISYLNQLIETETRRSNARNTIKTAENLSIDGTLQTNKFWEFKKQMDNRGKKELPSAMYDKEGNEKYTKEEILEIYENFYKNLFKPNDKTDKIEELLDKTKNTSFKKLINKASNKNYMKDEIPEERVQKAISQIKNKPTKDTQDLSNEILKNGGKDLQTSLTKLFNQVNNEDEGPKTWNEMIIKSIYKGKKDQKSMENRRGLFLTNVVSKLFEKVKINDQREMIENGISKFQTGGMKGKSRVDNIMTLNATIDYNNLINSETYVFFADAYKCFDKLDLKSSILDLAKIIGAREAQLLYNLNRNSQVIVKTPSGDTKMFEVGEIVKQGTLYGVILCDINTDKVNTVGLKNVSTIGPNIECEALIYVDDIESAGSHIESIETTAFNCSIMETTRNFIFNNGTDKTTFLVINPKKNNNVKALKNKIKRGEIQRSQEYMYLGEWYTEKYNHQKSLTEKRSKINIMIKKVKEYGNKYVVGDLALQVRFQLYERVVIPTLFTNIETWSTMSKEDLTALERMQKDIVIALADLPPGTPCMGLLSELGIWPIELLYEYKRIMLLHHILQSKETRLLKKIIEDQIINTYRGCWMEQAKELCEKYQINIDEIRNVSKDQLKDTMKKKVNDKFEETVNNLIKEKTKLRFCNGVKRKEYIFKLGYEEAYLELKLRLNMIEVNQIKSNQIIFF